MSLHLEFEPHSWYKGFAIKRNDLNANDDPHNAPISKWEAFTANGNTYMVDELSSYSLKDLKILINDYHIRHKNGYAERMKRSK